MPPSFPYGGMENPRLTFLTPTLLAGDRWLVNVVAHELAHSWTGNLVTNATAEHFWLNEGFTVFAERRILEALEGASRRAARGDRAARSSSRPSSSFAEQPELTRLRTHLAGRRSRRGLLRVPYEKGYLFLKALEAAAGREAFDTLLARVARDASLRRGDDGRLPRARRARAARRSSRRSTRRRGSTAPGCRRRTGGRESARLAPMRSAGRRACRRGRGEERGAPTEWQLYLEAMPSPRRSRCARRSTTLRADAARTTTRCW